MTEQIKPGAPAPAEQPAEIAARGFRRAGMDEVDADEFAQLVWLLDRQAEQPSIRRIRDWAVDQLAPMPGETAVDIGSGTGHDVQTFAGLVGSTGRAIGVEPNARMRAVADDRALAAGSTARFVDGDATTLPFDDASVDVVRSERVFQHLDDPSAAAAEVARVLRESGRAAIIDSDWDTAVIYPGDLDVVRRLREFQFSQWANPRSGRMLAKLLVDAGLVVEPDIGSTALVFPQALAAAAPMIQQSTAAAVGAGVLTDGERTTLLDGLKQAGEAGWAFISVTLYAVVARKPA
jgi:ubiquinone/menaquinone biosynthesis C-methylase UbiE